MKGNIIIAGLGLIGGSLALCLKREHPEAVIYGIDTNKEQAQLAKALQVVDHICEDLAKAAPLADLIILAAPVSQTIKLLSFLKSLSLKKDVIITDTGSTKEQIMHHAKKMNMEGSFIGGHPMAGSHKSGVAAAKDILFENAFYLLTPFEDKAKIDSLKNWLRGTRAQFVEVSSEEHDKMTGIISHFPHLIAASLVKQADRHSASLPLISRLAAGGFRDITRIASSSPEMWKDITLHNDQNLINMLETWKSDMDRIIMMLKNNDEDDILDFFQSAKAYRDQLPMKAKGAIPSYYDLYVDVPDYPGVISEVTGFLAEDRISITNIRIIETRADIYGVLVISFQTEEDREKAINCLQKQTDYDVFIP
ncbi:prephenate dehydrogenase [Falsibacillus pallidus]|uniref:Prephenate dehydrogenase n=1 Tax=Falsibacillus pallidus TaxID=493781 RepID=A0A370GH60_9BACI|nr:prephenate dehydrogenase [Falsibacillus pallidus]RDI42997.1 prephenate dehydrogenase [Falsibacillus pallidus]